MSKYSPEEYQKNKLAYKIRQQRYKSKNREKINSKQAEYRSENRDKHNIYANKRRNKIREKYDEYMQDKRCTKCGYDDSRSLVWHHINPTNKKNGVVQLVGKKHGWDTIMAEINKCVCLCHNCHNILHNHQSPSSP
jgi:excinuclease UvrABC ATPase subunit